MPGARPQPLPRVDPANQRLMRASVELWDLLDRT